jgi:hypothetical protein
LKCDPSRAARLDQHQPFLAAPIRLIGGRRLIARALRVAEKLPIELGQLASIGRVQDYLSELWERLRGVHQLECANRTRRGAKQARDIGGIAQL